jgi:hypothetical protein
MEEPRLKIVNRTVYTIAHSGALRAASPYSQRGVSSMQKSKYSLGVAEFVPGSCLASPSISIHEFFWFLGNLHHLTRENEFQERLWPTDTPISGAAP